MKTCVPGIQHGRHPRRGICSSRVPVAGGRTFPSVRELGNFLPILLPYIWHAAIGAAVVIIRAAWTSPGAVIA
jgi:hypothetical protein